LSSFVRRSILTAGKDGPVQNRWQKKKKRRGESWEEGARRQSRNEWSNRSGELGGGSGDVQENFICTLRMKDITEKGEGQRNELEVSKVEMDKNYWDNAVKGGSTFYHAYPL